MQPTRRPTKRHIVNRCEAIANLGGAALDGEECYMVQKFARALGVT